MTNTQARLEGSEEWNDYGDVSMYEAARQEAVKTSLSTFGLPQYVWLIEVRREGDESIPEATVRVKTTVVAEVLNPIDPALMELAIKRMDYLQEIARIQSAQAEELNNRKKEKVCVCCKDVADIKKNGYCHECWNELKLGIIVQPSVSERQLQSSLCRVIRKGTEMS